MTTKTGEFVQCRQNKPLEKIKVAIYLTGKIFMAFGLAKYMK